MKRCAHTLNEREDTVADGMCALCLAADNERLQTAMADLIKATRPVTPAGAVRGDDVIISAAAFGALYTAWMDDADELEDE